MKHITLPPKCSDVKQNTKSLKINFETMEVEIGDVSYGKIKGLIVGNDKITQTITISDDYYNKTFKSE
jgi:hypothetical protein